MNNRCAKFRTKPLEHVDLMERVYSGAAATGKHAWTPTEVQDDDTPATNAMDVDSGMGPLSAGTPPQPGHDTVGENVVKEPFEDAPIPWTDQPIQNGASGQLASYSKAAWTILLKLSNKVELKITQYVVTGKGENTVGECLARLMSTPGLETGGQLFSFACGIMDSPDNRDIIMALPLNCIVNWLTEKRACTPHNIGMDRQGGTRLFGSGGAVDLD
ncbi:hypothetical protein LOK49_LG13G01715 [Camellia lanceoleosa]|uniref:Uncharacterized protein n=1 Tax=Camellia lanceoleosa TaxID=1840588 RepID=A0ACC0FJX8_9ERIC|nr:hypothetical protein LOK49_LG13G01715 [Camellia lanceoleosa]